MYTKYCQPQTKNVIEIIYRPDNYALFIVWKLLFGYNIKEMSGHSFPEEYDQENKAFQNQPKDKEKIVSLAWSPVINRKILLYAVAVW